MQDLYKIVIALVGVIVGSWGLFGWIVKRWITETDANIKELYTISNIISNKLTGIIVKDDAYEKLFDRVGDLEKIQIVIKTELDFKKKR